MTYIYLSIIDRLMIDLGLILTKKSVNKAMVSRKTRIRESRLWQLSSNESAQLKTCEHFLIALAILKCEVLKEVYVDVKLENDKIRISKI